MKNLFLIYLLAISAILSGCGAAGPKDIISPTPQEVNAALYDTSIELPAGVRISRLETFPSLTSNELKIEISGGEKERAEIAAIFSALSGVGQNQPRRVDSKPATLSEGFTSGAPSGCTGQYEPTRSEPPTSNTSTARAWLVPAKDRPGAVCQSGDGRRVRPCVKTGHFDPRVGFGRRP